MAIITSLGLLVSTLAAALSRMMAEEISAWTPSIIHGLVKLAVARLTDNQRARFEEEWQSHVNEVPGIIGKLLAAIGFLVAAEKMSIAARHRQIVEDWLTKVKQVEASHSKLAETISLLRDDSRITAEEHVKIDPIVDRLSSLLPRHKEMCDRLATLARLYGATPAAPTRRLILFTLKMRVQASFEIMTTTAETLENKHSVLVKLLADRGSR